jgi:hypothetical protein
VAGVVALTTFFFFAETQYFRTNLGQVEEQDASAVEDGKHVSSLGHISPPLAASNSKKSFIQELKPWSRINPVTTFWNLICRPWPLILYPAAIYATLLFSMIVGWNVSVINTNASIFQNPPYHMTPGINSVGIKIPSFIGCILGTFCCGALADRYVEWRARKNSGIYEPETRLVLLILPFFIVPTGCLMYSLSLSPCLICRYGFGVQHKTSWAVPFIGNGFLGFGLAAAPTIMFAYRNYLPSVINILVIDAYAPIAAETLLIVSGLKQIFAFGYTYGVISWITKEGYAAAFGEMAGINTGVMLLGLPLYYWGKQIRQMSAKWKLLIW